MKPFESETQRARAAQHLWASVPITDRLRMVREFRFRLVEDTPRLTASVQAEIGRDPDQLVATDLLPTAAAARFLERRAARILAPRFAQRAPLWLFGCRDVVYRRPRGLVGILGTWNYPIFLNVIPILHALVAGNGVVWKPSEQIPRTAELLHELLQQSGFPDDLIQRVPHTREAGPQLGEADLDFIHFTGSEQVGRKLATRLGERLIPSTLELSGYDAMFVMADANVPLAAKLAWYGSTLNAGQTCLAVRRVLAAQSIYEPFVEHLRILAEQTKPVRLVIPQEVRHLESLVAEASQAGCTILPADRNCDDPAMVRPTLILNPNSHRGLSANRESLFAPLLTVTAFEDLQQARQIFDESPFGLTATIMTADLTAAEQLAVELPVGAVLINDVIAPTAHPDTPFGGHRSSGWGVTQGTEGLLEMTVTQVITRRGGQFRPHADHLPGEGNIVRGTLRMSHARAWGERLKGMWQLVQGLRGR